VRSAIGIASALITVGAGAGLLVAGPIVGHLDYHWLFWIPMIMTALAVAATVVLVPEPSAGKDIHRTGTGRHLRGEHHRMNGTIA